MQEEWIERLVELQKALAVCPGDILSRCDMALLCERLGRHEEALDNWNAVLEFDPNHLNAREGLIRCRSRTGRRSQPSR